MKRSISLTIIFLYAVLLVRGQELILQTDLDTAVNETSGLLYLNNTLITHNDSANTNQLFELDTTTGNITRTVTITNATNEDWEDITHDDTYIYIGDFGNNSGDRTDLKVYRILITDYFANTSVTADVINFSYSNQTDFTSSPFATNFDAEGLIHYNNSLYVFSKNWLDSNSNIYELPKTPGTYSVSSIDTIAAEGLVSGATYNALNNNIVLTGYDGDGAFLIQISGFNSGLFSNGIVTKTSVEVPTDYSPQVEAIVPFSTDEYYISAEENPSNSSGLYTFNTSTLNIQELNYSDISFYPNPAKNSITLSRDNLKTEIYSITGRLVKKSTEKHIDISNLNTGVYLIKIVDLKGNSINKKLIIID